MPIVPRNASLKLDFIIVGGGESPVFEHLLCAVSENKSPHRSLFETGLSGLATAISLANSGHRVRVFEKSCRGTCADSSSSKGVRMPPNGSRVLLQWGLEDEIKKYASENPILNWVDCERFISH